MSVDFGAIDESHPIRQVSLVGDFLRRRWWVVVVGLLLAGVVGMFSSTLSALVGPVTEVILNPRSEMELSHLLGKHLSVFLQMLGVPQRMSTADLLGSLPAILVVTAFAKTILLTGLYCLWEFVGEHVARRVRSDLFDGYIRGWLPVAEGGAETGLEGNLTTIISGDSRMVKDYLYNLFGVLPLEILQALWLAVTAYLLEPKLFLVFVFGVLPAGVVIGVIGRKLRKRSKAVLDTFSGLVEWLQSRILGIETIFHYRTQRREVSRMEDLSASLLDRYFRLARVRSRTAPLVETVAAIAFAVVIFLACRAVQTETTSAPLLLSFISALSFLGQSLSNLGRAWSFRSEGAAAARRVEDAYSTLSHFADAVPCPVATVEGVSDCVACSCRKVSVTYPGATVAALHDFSFDFRSGCSYCIVGLSGSGKSTLLSALIRVTPVTDGEIFLRPNAVSVDGVGLTFVAQNPLVAPISILENVTYPIVDGDRLRVEKSLRAVGLWERVVSLTQGIDTILEFDACDLSGGEAQRLHLARALYHRSPLVVVDEGTSALDAEVEAQTLRAFTNLCERGCCVIFVAHRMAALEYVDEVLLLVDGKLTQSGAVATVKDTPEFAQFLRG